MQLDHTQLCGLGLAPELEKPPPGGPRVEICLCHLSPQEMGWEAHSTALSTEEAQVASRFVFDEHRRRFVQSHRALRNILGRHCGLAPQNVEFRLGAHGRPCVRNANVPLDFNMSHTGDWAVIAVSLDGWVGIDVEALDREGWRDLAATLLTPGEQRQLESMAEPLRAARFIEYWTAKEAFMKLNGLGLGVPAESIEVQESWSSDARCETAAATHHPSALAVRRACLTRIVATDKLSCTLATTAPPREVISSWWAP